MKVLLLLASMLVFPQAHAGMLTFNYTDNLNVYNVTGSMTFANVTSPIGNGNTVGWEILGISGFVFGPGGGAITGLIDNPSSPDPHIAFDYLYDNIVFLTEPYVNILGVLFQTDSGSIWNLYEIPESLPKKYELHSIDAGVIRTGSLTIDPGLPGGPEFPPGPAPVDPGLPPGPIRGVPEPGTILLFGIGLIAFSLFAHPKQQQSVLSYS